eukprot:TRINITY_DN82779_c0_g1_i1.p1 TRINITY_DN82779_c0_g1~~TRINITY_DN82779_c0_g1_i1.p1  ORF type:complete len:333 (+),score=42.60 TRINITY_DN82779_c0_g1_i1:138-1136(+)
MVGMAMTFGNPDYSTPHGGPPFQGWKKGFGFGHGEQASAGGQVLSPAVPCMLRFTPKGERGFSSSPFWRNKYEVGKAAGMGIGDRPDYARMANKSGSVAPDNYGDVAPQLKNARRNASRAGITFHRKIDPLKAGDPGGPGPARYDTSYKPGQSSWDHGSKCPSFSMQSRRVVDQELVYKMGFPGPDTYNARMKTGEKPPDRHGTLYDVALKGRIPKKEMGNASPGPAKYWVKGSLDRYTLGTMIEHTPVPPEQLPRWYSSPNLRGTAPAGMFASDGTNMFGTYDIEGGDYSPGADGRDMDFGVTASGSGLEATQPGSSSSAAGTSSGVALPQ